MPKSLPPECTQLEETPPKKEKLTVGAAEAQETAGIPIEIPWRLHGTTGAIIRDRVDPVFAAAYSPSLTISSYHVPEALTRDAYPGKRVVYFKFTVTVTPGRLEDSLEPIYINEPTGEPDETVARDVLSWTDPARALLLDIFISAEGGVAGTKERPAAYFASAAPLSRDYEQRFSVSVEEESSVGSTVRTGDSTTQSTESVDSTTTTKKDSSGGAIGGIALPLFGGYASSSSKTTVTIDATTDVATSESWREQSEAARRRRAEGFSAQVTNLLALLRGRFVGTQNLQFSVRPRPLSRPPRDRLDSDAWYAIQLENLSRGLDGVQEFFGVAVINADVREYAVESRLRVAYVASTAESPAPIDSIVAYEWVGTRSGSNWRDDEGKLTFRQRSKYNGTITSLRFFLNRAFPPGTSVDSLDIDVTSAISTIRELVPPAVVERGEDDDEPNTTTLTNKPMGPSAVTIRRWLVPFFLSSEQRRVDEEKRRYVPKNVLWQDLYAAVVVEWTEWVPLPTAGVDNQQDRDQKATRLKFDPTKFSGELIPVVRKLTLPYKSLMAVTEDANRSRAAAGTARLMEPIREQLAYARGLKLSVVARLDADRNAPPNSKPAVAKSESSVVIAPRPLRMTGRLTLAEATRALTIDDAELARRLSSARFTAAVTPASVVRFLVARVESLTGAAAPGDLAALGKWANVKLEPEQAEWNPMQTAEFTAESFPDEAPVAPRELHEEPGALSAHGPRRGRAGLSGGGPVQTILPGRTKPPGSTTAHPVTRLPASSGVLIAPLTGADPTVPLRWTTQQHGHGLAEGSLSALNTVGRHLPDRPNQDMR